MDKGYVIYGFIEDNKISVAHIVHDNSYLGTKKENDLKIKFDFKI